MADEAEAETGSIKGGLTDVRSSDFRETYANNLRFENSVWDIRMQFGVLDQQENVVRLHTAVNVPWVQAKLMAYYLHINVAFHEMEHGAIKVPERVMPPSPASFLSEGELKVKPDLQAVYDRLMAHWKTL